MYAFLLIVHSNLRWVVLSLGVAVLVLRALPRSLGTRTSLVGERLHRALIGSLHLQLVAGVLLYVAYSPLTRPFIDQVPSSLRDSILRFYGLEHPVSMVIALIFLQLGRFCYRRAGEATSYPGWIFTALGLAAMLIAVPWPWLVHGRPWARWGGTDSVAANALPVAACPPIYVSACATCHGEHGRGDGPAAPYLRPRPRDFAASEWLSSRSDEQIETVIRAGGPALGLTPVMPPHPGIRGEELRKLVTCVRGFSSAARSEAL